MFRFSTVLVPGTRAPYDTWTFVVVPPEADLAPGPVRGTLAGIAFRGTLSRGEGALRMPVTRARQTAAGVSRLDRVEVTLEPDPEARPVGVPEELQALLDADPELAGLFEKMAPSHRRAWTAYIGEAVRPTTRQRRAEKAPAGIRARAFPK